MRVAGGRHQAEAELIQGMLLEEGVPSMLRRSPGFDVPDFLAAGPRDVFVPEAGARGGQGGVARGRHGPAGPHPRGRLGAEARRGTPPASWARCSAAAPLAALVAWAAIQLAG